MPLPEAPATGQLPFPPPTEFSPDLAEFWELWRQEKFWACHEALEEVWQHETEPRKQFLNGLIHGAVAVFQHRRGNFVGAARQLTRAQVKLNRHRPSYEGVDCDAFLAGIDAEIAPSLAQLSDKQRVSLRELETRLRLKYADENCPPKV
jgi:predicted metal-dependent hydrolase